MLCIIDKGIEPYWNLAAEEYLFNSYTEPVFRLWRNDKSIIIGQNQNALAEINYDFVKEHNIPVVRRLSGGGAVFHDPGNVNFTFISEIDGSTDTSEMFVRFTEPILTALHKLGVNAMLQGRNDLTVDGRKISGNAIYKRRNRILMHGTLLFNASMNNLAEALKYRPEKFVDKAVKSNRSRVTNISEHLTKPMDVETFMDFLASEIGHGCKRREYTDEDIAAIDLLYREKYSTDKWNISHSPAYSFNKVVKFPCGLIELSMDVEKGRISAIEIRGDYFFTLPTEDFCKLMTGCEHTEKAIADRLAEIPVGEYFNGLDGPNLTSLFF